MAVGWQLSLCAVAMQLCGQPPGQPGQNDLKTRLQRLTRFYNRTTSAGPFYTNFRVTPTYGDGSQAFEIASLKPSGDDLSGHSCRMSLLLDDGALNSLSPLSARYGQERMRV